MSLAEQHNARAPSYHVGLSLYSPVGAEGPQDVLIHTRRAHALHHALANVGGIEVTHWGATDAPSPSGLSSSRSCSLRRSLSLSAALKRSRR